MSKSNTLTFPTYHTDTLKKLFDDNLIDYNCIGAANYFTGVAPINGCDEQHLTWSKRGGESVLDCPARVVILPVADSGLHVSSHNKTLFFVTNPRAVFRLITSELFQKQYDICRGFSDSSFFGTYDNGSRIACDASIAEGVVFGADVIIHPGVVIYPNVILGDNVEILPGCVIGAPGFGHVRLEDGSLEHFPHIGGVSIGSNVTIGSNTCIDSGGLSPTIIRDGSKIGNLTQIAHNVEIEEDCLIGTRCQIAGGTRIGRETEIWAGVTISNNRLIGEKCSIKIGSVVITHLPDNSVVSGNFACSHENRMLEFKRQTNIISS